MEEYRDRSLDLFLDLAFDAEKGLPQDKPSCASFLYKWLGIIESCRQVGGGLILGEPWPQQAVQTVLADIDLMRTWTLVGNIRQALLNVVLGMLSRQIVNVPTPTVTKITFDERDKMVFRFDVAIGSTIPGYPQQLPVEYVITLTIFLNLVSYLHLEEDRFQRCPRCGRFFYQYGRKSQKFCSRQCSDLGRTGVSYQPPQIDYGRPDVNYYPQEVYFDPDEM